MREHDRRSIRILFDMQAAQTSGSAQRGVGRYSQALFSAIAAAAPPREIHAVAASHHPFPFVVDGIPRNRQHLVSPPPDWNSARDFEGGDQDSLDAGTLSAAISRINPDVVHVSHLFEGYDDRVALPCFPSKPAGRLTSATLYDLIPLRFSDHYFQDTRFKRWYFHRLNWLRQADLLLSISESSRQDAIDLLGLDADRIVTIHGGISPHFQPIAADPAGVRERFAARYGVNRRRFILYTGGDDHRKNLQGAISGYAALPSEIRQDTQLVILCAIEPHRKKIYLDLAREKGINKDDVIFVGFVPEDDLVAFYSTCDVFVFPSLYEGLGLPVLEAMACGAPVIAGNNSSIRELIPEAEALFDSASASSIGECIHRVLTDTPFANELRRKGAAHARIFSWERSARTALDAFDESLRKKREDGTRVAQSGWLKRQRLAMFTPLPPCRSGIADYNAQFLPFLAEHFDIDLYVDGYKVSDLAVNAAFRVFDCKDFPGSASAYDAILYEFGNSEFHVHMLPLLARFPGVVGLHDAFLSGMMGYLEFSLGETDRYAREMLDAHSGQARRLMAPVVAHPNAIGATMVHLPCAKRVLHEAVGIISHSPFNLKIARQFHPEGWAAPYRIIPQMVAAPESWEEQIEKTRADLGFRPDDYIVATFGHVAWTKCGDRLLEAFLMSNLAADPHCHLIFAGELAKDDFGAKLNERLRAAGLGKRIKITGFLPEKEYARYLRITDVAVQLRTKSRGGTPKVVLDCLANGIPVIVNDEASYEDYPDDVVIKLDPNPTPRNILDQLETLKNNPGRRRAFAERGRTYVREHHDPRLCAAQYAAAIYEFTSRYSATQAENHVLALAPHLAGCPQPMQSAEIAADFLNSLNVPSFRRRRLVIDASHIAKDDHGTGIPRVMRETVRSAYCSERSNFSALAVELVGEELVEARSWLNRQRLLLPFEMDGATTMTPIVFRPGDHLLMLDSSWARYAEFAPAFSRARAASVPITTAVYDLLPITLPEGNTVAGGKEWFEAWLRSAIAASDSLICISKSMADELIGYIGQQRLGRKGLKVGYWHLGANLPVASQCAADSPVRGLRGSYTLMVGTIEPRKNHALALDAFERLWRQGLDLSLVVAGKPGWMVEDLLERLRLHNLRNERLFFFEGLGDFEIAHLYRNASALLFPSKGEGFGLPLVEAAQYGTPIICSDIPVFREIAETNATYVPIGDAARLADAIAAWFVEHTSGRVPRSSNLRRLSWEESAESMIDVVLGDSWYWVQPE